MKLIKGENKKNKFIYIYSMKLNEMKNRIKQPNSRRVVHYLYVCFQTGVENQN